MNEISEELVDLIKLLGDQTRLKILYTLRDEEELCVSSIEDRLSITQSHLSQQLKKLHEANLLLVKKEGRKKFYKLRNRDIFKIIKQLRAYLNNIEQDIIEEKIDKISDRDIMDTLL